jgi:hypothetical protein
MSNLVEHARIELELLGEYQEVIDGFLDVIQAFANMGHSGSSAAFAIPTISKLLSFENISPLTDDPDEWQHHSEEFWGAPNGIWQNKRNSKAFSKDGGKTFYLLDDKDSDNPYDIFYVSIKKVEDDTSN